MRIRIDTLGCRVNRYDSAALAGDLLARGHEIVEGERFDVYVLNSCTVTQAADAEARRLVGRARRLVPEARLVMTGCLAETAPQEVARLPVDLVVPNREKDRLGERIDALAGVAATMREVPFPAGDGTRFFFKIQDGCDVRCTFCIIPDARGTARSIPAERVIAAVGEACARGFREAVLVGIHLGAYGRDQPGAPTLAGLVRRLLDQTPIERLRLGSLEPWGVREELVELLRSEPRFLPMLHLPLQSGSEHILRAMRRPITATRYERIVDSLIEARPDLALYVDVLVGFPGESEADFEATCRLLERIPFTKLHVFPYSSRPHTPAAALPGGVASALKKERVRRLIDRSDARFAERMARRVGSTCEVLVEAGEIGHTRDHFPCLMPGRAKNELVKVRLMGVSACGALEATTIEP